MIFFLTIFISTFASALETDNYLVWDRELKDSTFEVNQYLNQEIRIALKASNTQSCEEVTFAIANRFKSTHPEKSPVELWLKSHLSSEQLYPADLGYVEKSIYRNPYRFYVPYFKLSPNVRIQNIYFGTDKLIHFTSTGRRYLEHYLEKREKGFTDLDAQRSMIRFGLFNENTLLGAQLTGVISYGDMEANFQGFNFYRRFCLDDKMTYLTRGPDGLWELKSAVDIRDYINPLLDESFNHSYLMPKNWIKAAPVIKELYCPMTDKPIVKDRLAYYQKVRHESFSSRYIEELKRQAYKMTPDPEIEQSFHSLCHQ